MFLSNIYATTDMVLILKEDGIPLANGDSDTMQDVTSNTAGTTTVNTLNRKYLRDPIQIHKSLV